MQHSAAPKKENDPFLGERILKKSNPFAAPFLQNNNQAVSGSMYNSAGKPSKCQLHWNLEAGQASDIEMQ